ncbi:MAG: response regulator [Candidatus Bipolaricaulia bacterium]
MRILVVEDETKLAKALQRGLSEEGYAVDLAFDGQDGLHWARTQAYDLIVLDLMIPEVEGLELLKLIRTEGQQVPVLVLTARDAVDDRVKGLDTGADDYLTKPFAFDELLARVRALLRREISASPNHQLRIADLELDRFTRQVWRNEEPIELTAKEFELLEYFMQNANRVLSRTQLSEHVWGEFDTLTNVIDVYIHRLREKVDEGFSPKLLYTVRGAGYVLKDPHRDATA